MATVVMFSDECVKASQAVKSGKARYCIFVVNANAFEIYHLQETKEEEDCQEQWNAFANHLPKDKCAYCFVNFSYMSPTDQVERSKVVFVLWSPENAKMKEKMMTAFSANGVLNKIGEGGISARIQAGCSSTIDYNVVVEHVLAKATVK
jgi:cofilin